VANETIAEYVARRTGCAVATREMDAAASALGNTAPSAPGAPDPNDVYASALDRWLASGAADLDDRLPAMLADLGLAANGALSPASLMRSLTGARAARVVLAALLRSDFDVVLLDEPTIALDPDCLEGIESFIQGLRGCVVLVGDDREFLARCVK